ncbi:MAG TPA: prephenate dehydratase domain-containing protein [Gemmatimonadaceae bacterium]|nr:prephenate dehydratase domain-containing protein [Gemmatimonadaceae bacterium]
MQRLMERLTERAPEAAPYATPGAAPRVAYQGEPGAFSEQGVALHWAGAAEAVPLPTFGAVADAVAEGTATYGLLPVENSIVGPVHEAVIALGSRPLAIVGELRLPIRQCLLAPSGSTLDALTSVESHPVALAQCGRFLRAHPQLRPRAVLDTAAAARAVADAGDRTRAAIASAAAAARYGLVVLAEDVHDPVDNTTRFVVVARADAPEGRW